MEVTQEKHISHANTNPIMETDVNEPGNPETEDKKTHNSLIPMPAPPKDPVKEVHKLCDQDAMKFETPVGSEKQLSNSLRTTPDRSGPLEGEEVVVLHEERAHQAGLLERADTIDISSRPVADHLPDSQVGVQDIAGGRGAEKETPGMRPLGRPAGRLEPQNEHLDGREELIFIDVSMEEPEEAGANAKSPSPEYGDPVKAAALMEVAKEAGAAARSPNPELEPGH